MELPRHDERDHMTDQAQLAAEYALTQGELITDREFFNTFVEYLGTAETLDATQTVRQLEMCSPHLQEMFKADIGLLRPARLGEHTEADLSGLEQDYINLFNDPEHRQILRLASLARDSGKSLCYKITGSSRNQTMFNATVTEAMLDAVGPHVMADDAKEVVRQLVASDPVGKAMRGYYDQAELDSVRQQWPERFSGQFGDFWLVSYMADASAHTMRRTFTDIKTGEVKPCVAESDVRLDFLFEPDASPVVLTQPFRRLASAMFPDRQATRELWADEPKPELAPHEYVHTTEAEGVWASSFTMEPVPYSRLKEQIETFSMATGFPLSVLAVRSFDDTVRRLTIVRDPSRRFGTQPPEAHDRTAQQLAGMFGWEAAGTPHTHTADVSACIGLLEGYDEATGTLHNLVEATAFLLEHDPSVHWTVDKVTLLSARRVLDDQYRYKLEIWDEPALHATATHHDPEARTHNQALQTLTALAHSFNQQRFFADDMLNVKTVSYSR